MLNYLVCMLAALSPIIFSYRFGGQIRSVPKQFVLIAGLAQSSMSSFAGSDAESVEVMEIDQEYPGTAVQRMQAIRQRVRSLTPEQLNGDWESVRRSLLWAGGLRDLTNVAPGRGYTGHSFNDFNHCDLTAMRDDVAEAEHNGEIEGIGPRNALGEGIRIASLPELGLGGSWTTCMMGCHHDPPRDVAHVQFRARIAFKLVWAPPAFTMFVLIDDSGALLAQGRPTGVLPDLQERATNYQIVRNSKYAMAANALGVSTSARSNSTITRAG